MRATKVMHERFRLSTRARALMIAMLGVAIQAFGGTWDVIYHGLVRRVDPSAMTFRHLVSDPAHLTMAAGFLVCLVCIPIALQVIAAGERDLAIPDQQVIKDASAVAKPSAPS